MSSGQAREAIVRILVLQLYKKWSELEAVPDPFLFHVPLMRARNIRTVFRQTIRHIG
jgi:hypothetical protein